MLLQIQNVYVNVDVSKFAQVIRNFISNALKFTPRQGSVSVRASVVPVEGDNTSHEELAAVRGFRATSSDGDVPKSIISEPTATSNETSPGRGWMPEWRHMFPFSTAGKRIVTPLSPG